MSADGKPILVVMARRPEAGRVKTRLEPELGAEMACRLYAAMLEDVLDASISQRWRTVVAITPGDAAAEPGPWIGMETLPQEGDNLAERAQGLFERLLSRAPAVIMRNSDGPDIAPERIAEAFETLARDDVDLVVGPDLSGGYCMLGLKAPHLGLFAIDTDRSHKLEDTLARARELKLRTEILPPEADVNTPIDLDALAIRLGLRPSRRELCPRTAAIINELAASQQTDV